MVREHFVPLVLTIVSVVAILYVRFVAHVYFIDVLDAYLVSKGWGV